MHNPYPLLFQKEVFDATRARADRVVAWSRSAAPGVQRYPGHWSGDPECTFVDLANTLKPIKGVDALDLVRLVIAIAKGIVVEDAHAECVRAQRHR